MSARLRVCVGTTLVGSFLFAAACASPVVDEKARAKAKIHYDIGVAQMNAGDMRGALRELLLCDDLDPQLFPCQNALGLVYHAVGRKTEALEHYRKALTLDPKSSQTHNNVGVLLTDMGRYVEAIAAFEEALADILYPTPSLAEGNMGWAYYKKGETEAGIRHLKNAVATDPRFCRGYLWLARIGLDQKDAEITVSNARRFARHCLQDETIAATIPTAYVHEMKYYLALGYLEQGMRQAARDALAECAGDGDDSFAAKCQEALKGL